MTQRRSLDDTCDIFLSGRRVRSPLAGQHAASEYTHDVPKLCPENLAIPPYFLLPRPLEIPDVSDPALSHPVTKPLPLPGSSGIQQLKPTRMTNGRTHVPRPRNPFILFRCDLVHQRKMLPRSDLDDTNISRIAGDLWREMTSAQKKPWVELAAQEKARHAQLYPDYKYAPAIGGQKSKKAKGDNNAVAAGVAHVLVDDRPPRQVSRMDAELSSDHARPHRQTERPRPYPQIIPRRRSSSCPPPGAIPVPSQSPLEEWSPPLVTRDDMPVQRRQSRTVMYHSVTQLEAQQEPVAQPVAPMPVHYNSPLVQMPLQSSDWFNAPQVDPSLLDCTYPTGMMIPDLNQCQEYYPAQNYDFFDKPIFIPDAGTHAPFTAQELSELERLTIGTSFTDPFTSIAAISMGGSPYAYPMAISPFDCSSYSTSTDSPSSSTSSGMFSAN